MHHRCKGSINLHSYITSLKAYRVRYFIAINMNAHKCAIDKLYFDFFVAGLKRDLRLGFALSSLLNLFNDKFHLGDIERLIGLRPPISNSICDTFYELTGNSNNGLFSL